MAAMVATAGCADVEPACPTKTASGANEAARSTMHRSGNGPISASKSATAWPAWRSDPPTESSPRGGRCSFGTRLSIDGCGGVVMRTRIGNRDTPAGLVTYGLDALGAVVVR